MKCWPLRRWVVVASSAVAAVLFVGVPTALIPTPLFGRAVAPTMWAWPVLLVTAMLSGLVTATYVATSSTAMPGGAAEPSRGGVAGGFLVYLAVGCPACNKIALLALGATGAIRWFAPVQPLLAIAGILLLAYALRRRLAGERACPVPTSASARY